MLHDVLTDRFIPTRTRGDRIFSADKNDQASTNYSRIISPGKHRCFNFSHRSLQTHQTLSEFIYKSCHKKLINKTTKQIKKAVKVLDAPDVIDNFYYSPLDWCKGDNIGIALQNTVFILKPGGQINQINRFSNIPVSCLKMHNEGATCLFGEQTGRVQVFDTEKNSRLRTINSHYSRVGSICISGRGLFFSGSKDKIIKYHDLRLKKSDILTWQKHRGEICGMSLSHQYLASGGNDNKVIIWDIRKNYPIVELKKHNSAVKAVAWCPWKNNLLMTGGGYKDGKIIFWNGNTQQNQNIIETGCQVSSLIAREDSKSFISANSKISKGTAMLWDSSKSIQVKTKLKGHYGRIIGMALSPDNQNNLCTVSADETLRIWDLSSEQKYNFYGENIQQQSIFNCHDVR